MTSKIEQLATDFSNSWERINAIVEDMAALEPTSELSAAAVQGFLRELQAEAITAIITTGEIQRIGRKDGYPGDFDKEETQA